MFTVKNLIRFTNIDKMTGDPLLAPFSPSYMSVYIEPSLNRIYYSISRFNLVLDYKTRTIEGKKGTFYVFTEMFIYSRDMFSKRTDKAELDREIKKIFKRDLADVKHKIEQGKPLKLASTIDLSTLPQEEEGVWFDREFLFSLIRATLIDSIVRQAPFLEEIAWE